MYKFRFGQKRIVINSKGISLKVDDIEGNQERSDKYKMEDEESKP